jgi:hypothetical protein
MMPRYSADLIVSLQRMLRAAYLEADTHAAQARAYRELLTLALDRAGALERTAARASDRIRSLVAENRTLRSQPAATPARRLAA